MHNHNNSVMEKFQHFSQNPHCVRDLSGKPGARNERGLGTESPTRRGTPKSIKN